MRRRDLLTVCLLMASAPAGAQDRVALTFAPELGRMARTLTELRTSTTLVGFPTVPDGAVFSEETWISGTQRVTGLEAEGVVVEVVIDSVRGRVRMGQDPWRDRADSSVMDHPAQALVSPQFRIVGIRSSGTTDGEVLQVMGAYAAGLGFAFPPAPVAVGETFATGGRIRARLRTDAATGIAIDEVVFGDLALTLDSVVRTGPEQLSFLHFQGSLTPRTAAVTGEDGDVVTQLSGGFAGRLVWSAQWGAFVSGAIRLRVTGQIQVQGPGGADTADVVWDRTIVHRVRP